MHLFKKRKKSYHFFNFQFSNNPRNCCKTKQQKSADFVNNNKPDFDDFFFENVNSYKFIDFLAEIFKTEYLSTLEIFVNYKNSMEQD